MTLVWKPSQADSRARKLSSISGSWQSPVRSNYPPILHGLRAQHGIDLIVQDDRHISGHCHLSLGLPHRSSGKRSDAAPKVSLSDLGGPFNPTWDLRQFQMLDPTNGLRSGPSQWFLPVVVWESDAPEAIERVYGWTSTSAGTNHLSYEFLVPRESGRDSIQAEGCGIPIDWAVFSRQRTCFSRTSTQ